MGKIEGVSQFEQGEIVAVKAANFHPTFHNQHYILDNNFDWDDFKSRYYPQDIFCPYSDKFYPSIMRIRELLTLQYLPILLISDARYKTNSYIKMDRIVTLDGDSRLSKTFKYYLLKKYNVSTHRYDLYFTHNSEIVEIDFFDTCELLLEEEEKVFSEFINTKDD